MSYWAYIDESEAELSSGESAYVIAATFIADTDRADIRQQMISLKPSHLKKVHWYEEPSPRRAKLVAEIADFQALHQVVVRWCGDHESQERRSVAGFASITLPVLPNPCCGSPTSWRAPSMINSRAVVSTFSHFKTF